MTYQNKSPIVIGIGGKDAFDKLEKNKTGSNIMKTKYLTHRSGVKFQFIGQVELQFLLIRFLQLIL